ncbi:MAG: long-chain fatty acid--CoA ligase [Nitrospiraceae bacterium]|nr:MAG: long-chain fatty acid--CoA ligase [Nitrospiraceae bacterium]
MTLSTLLSYRAGKSRTTTLIKFGSERLSYQEVDNRVTLCTGGLISLGLKRGGRVAILMENCPEYIVSYFAILRAGGIAVPVNTFLTPDEISYILNDAGCEILIHDDAFAYHAKKIRSALQRLKPVVFDAIPRREAEERGASEGGLAVLLYTSGTTGFPKGAMLTHGNLLSNAEASASALEVTYRDRFLVFLPLFHSFTFTACVLVPLCSGASVVLLKSVKPFSLVVKSIIRDRITLLAGVPTVYNILSRKRMPFYMKYVLKIILNLRACISGAAALPEDTLRNFEERFRVPLIEGYGLTEASPVVAVNPLRGPRKPASVGLPLPGIEVSIIDEEGNTLGAGDTGELLVKGPNVMQGYYNLKEETEAALKGGWLHTGDMARMDDDGYLFIVDRKKDLIIVDGMNVYPRQVEDMVMKHPSVEECAMVGIPDGRGSETPVLFIKTREGVHAEEDEILRHLRGHVARFKMPRRIFSIDEFPKTATGKIRKPELRKWSITGRAGKDREA